jgi:hypothetical protein
MVQVFEGMEQQAAGSKVNVTDFTWLNTARI